MNATPPELIIYEENKPKVLHDLKDGRVDYLDLTRWDFTDRFFAFLLQKRYFDWCASTYPTPRKKEEVPAWFLLACILQMRLHVEVAFDNLPGILRSGAILTRAKFNVGLKGGGFNYKNRRKRLTAVNQDTVRKYYKDTAPEKLKKWYNEDVVGWFRHYRGFDKEGIFILDKSFLFVADNPNYENSSLLAFDRNGNQVDVKNLSPEQRKMVEWRRCYSLVSLLHTNELTNYYIYAGSHVGPGSESGLTEGEKLVDGFVERFGKRIIKLLIVDRGYIDGPMITRFKEKYRIDTLVPLRRGMAALEDAKGLAGMNESSWELYSEEKDKNEKLIKRKEVIAFKDIRSWDKCGVPLYVALMRVTEADGSSHIWGLASTRVYEKASEAFDWYKKRTKIEERHRQFKGCWRLCEFTSTNFSLVAAQVITSLMVYSLIEFYLMRHDMQRLANKTIRSLRAEERLGRDAAIVYSGNYFATFDIDEYSKIIADLKEPPRKRFLHFVRALRKHNLRLKVKAKQKDDASRSPGVIVKINPTRGP